MIMKRIRLMSTARGMAALAILWAGQLVVPAGVLAQETENETVEAERVVVEVRDGKVFVNGKETEVGDTGRIVLRKGDGDRVVVITGKDGPLWYSATGLAPRLRAETERARDMARMAYRLHVPEPGENDLFLEFESPDLSHLEGMEFDVDVEGRLAEAFESVDGLRGNLFRLQEQSGELREMESRIREKARQIRRAENGERAALETELDALLNEAFALKLKQEREDMQKLEQRLTELQHRLQERETNRRDIIERRKKEMLGRRDSLDW